MGKKKAEREMSSILEQTIMAIYEVDGNPERAIGYAMAAIKADTVHEINIDMVNEYYKDAISIQSTEQKL